MRKPKEAIDYLQRLKILDAAGFDSGKKRQESVTQEENDDSLCDLQTTIKRVLNIINSKKRPKTNMLFFVMYDIESTKVRTSVVKYLQRKGCTRIQKSIFLADLSFDVCNEIKRDLTKIQALYDNHDSIIICPVSTDEIQNMKIIGHSIDIDIITHATNTLFF